MRTVCVTGGTGFVASWLIKRLLQDGYFVHTTIRSYHDRKRDVTYLTNLPGASERLRIFNADLDEPDSFKPAIEGCAGVFHVAHSLTFAGNETQETINNRGINGTLGILQACLDAKTVKRVVLTSSGATVLLNDKNLGEVDEESWSDLEFIKAEYGNTLAPYFISKVVAEKAAIEFAEKHCLDLVIINPTYINGPFITPTCPLSIRVSLAMIFGDNLHKLKSVLNVLQVVHIDDVASAHIFLLEHPDAKGRYLCSATEISIHEMAEFLSTRYPEFQIKRPDLSKEKIKPLYSSPSSGKLLAAGFEFKYGLEEMYDEAIQSCREKAIL